MGHVLTPVTVRNFADPSKEIRCNALLDTGATMLTLPTSWREQLGTFLNAHRVDMEVATQESVSVEVCGPAMIQIAGFREIAGEVCFLEMAGGTSGAEALLGCITLAQSGATVDPVNRRLIRTPYYLK